MIDSKRTVNHPISSLTAPQLIIFLDHRRSPAPRRRRDSIDNEAGGAKLRVENIHWDLTEEDLDVSLP